MKKNLYIKSFSLLLLILFLTGCWSAHEIEELSLEVGIALDKGELSSTEEELEKQDELYPKKDNITVTFQTVNTKIASAGSKSGGSEQKAYFNISETSDSLFQIDNEISLRKGRPLTGYHLKVIIISEELLRMYSMGDLLDSYLRDNDIRPSCLVLISKNRASEVLESNENGEIPSFSLVNMVENKNISTKILPPMPLAKLTGIMKSESSFLLQNIIPASGEVKISGAAVIKGKSKKLIGFFNEKDLEGISWITGKEEGGLVKSYYGEKEKLIVYNIQSIKSNIIPHINGDDISFEVKVQTDGNLSEDWVTSEKSSNNKFLKEVEKIFETEIKQLIMNVVQKMQDDYQVEVAGFGNQLKIKYPEIWNEVKVDWDETFSKIPIKYNIDVTISNYGTFISYK
ncbi:Ger(x)C family spore germination protein (plasmid) [Cytobacillus solani]|uniref:Ger(x)C family spore germination protein n=1 Tax=Cytobacillus solani TaxID=1637975 RepID=UPI00207ABCD1|nr:Ger(x)C family spore germination protein [Cytobacillus solani]USK57744.1 Ger(x)C family spore germination protein [Cytobacillus solani]